MATRKAAAKPPARKPGRPSKLSEEMCEQARKLCLLGATNPELGDFFQVATSTISKWIKENAKFSDAVKKGRAVADAEVAASLFERATGATWTEESAFKLKDGPHNERVEIVEVRKEAPPDTAAAFIWLKNRRPDLWRDKREEEAGGDEAAKLLSDLIRRMPS